MIPITPVLKIQVYLFDPAINCLSALTIQVPPPIVAAMIAELDTLEAKIRLVTEYCETLRSDNVDLRQQLLTAQQELRQVNTRLETASSRLQALLEKIPESA